MIYIFILSVLTFLTPFTFLVLAWKPKNKTQSVRYSVEVNRLLEMD